MDATTFKGLPPNGLHPEWAIIVRFHNGVFSFTVADTERKVIVAQGGADRELPTVNQLVAASHEFIAWRRLRQFRRDRLEPLELTNYDPEVRPLLASSGY